MKHETAFVGLGQGGSNLVDEMYLKGYDSLLINSAYNDLAGNECKNQYHIAGTYGCNKSRSKGLELAYDKHEQIAEVIYNTFPKKRVINIGVATGGGFGSGSAPLVIECLKANYPKKIFNLAPIFPSLSEDTKNLKNAISFFYDLEKIEGVNGIFVLDNNNMDRFELNKQFADKYEKMMYISNPDKRGVIDVAELETTLSPKGCIYIASVKDNFYDRVDAYANDINFQRNIDIARLLEEQVGENVFAPFTYGCKYMALSLAHDKVNTNSLNKLVGNPTEDRFVGYNKNGEHLIVVSGMSFPKQIIAKLIHEVNKREAKLEEEQYRNEIQMPKLHQRAVGMYEENKNIEKKVDINAILNKFR